MLLKLLYALSKVSVDTGGNGGIVHGIGYFLLQGSGSKDEFMGPAQ